MLTLSPKWLPLAVAFALSQSMLGDIVTLKSGAKIEGRILEETATEVTIEYHESATILDRKTVKRDEIASIDKETPDVAAWNAIKDVKLGTNSLAAKQYEDMLRPIASFIATYPANPHLDEAKKIVAALEGEKKRVDGGEVKVADKWLTKEEAEKERYQLSALLTLNYMRSQATGGDLIGAMNTFDQIEKTYSGAKSYPDAIELARQALPRLQASVERAYQVLKTEATNRAQVGVGTRADLDAAAKREEDAGVAAMTAAEKGGLKWPPFATRSSKVLAKIAGKIAPETKRLGDLPVPAMRQSFQIAEGAKAQLAVNDVEGAGAALQEAAKLWSANEIVKRLTPEIAEAKKAAAMVAAEPVAKVEEAPKPVVEEKKPEREPPPVEVAAPVQEEEKKSFFMTVPGWITIVVVIAGALIGLNVFNKMRKRGEEGE